MKIKNIINTLAYIFIAIGICFINIEIIYILVISLSIVISLYKFKENIHLFLLSIMMGYFNYSIIIHEYLKKNLRLTFHGLAHREEFYLLMLKLIFLFNLAYILFLTKKKYQERMIKKNNIVYFTLYVCLIYIGIFKIKRDINLNEYTVMITPIYEYSYLIFGYLFLYSNNKRKICYSVLLAVFFCLQDAYYGGRATSIQIIICLLLSLFTKYLSWKRMIGGATIGIVLLSLIGGYREKVSISKVIDGLTDNLFLNDTSVMAFISSITHLATIQKINWYIRVESGIIFLKTLIFGSKIENSGLADVTVFSAKFFPNAGGGVFVSHIYFWYGELIFIVVIYILFLTIDKIFKIKNNEYFYLVKIFIVASSPRWYLYSPLSLIRGPIILNLIIYICINFYKKFIQSIKK